MSFSADDQTQMAKALGLAELGLYSTSPNPRVGCVLVRDGAVIGQGWHVRAGEDHAEVHALRQAGGSARGATAYVTLEPCAHQGRTGPCADALIAAGVHRVVLAMMDPNPLVAGKGMERLRAAGVVTEVGLLENQARELNIGFVSRMERGQPWVRLKAAASLDGKTALNNGVSQWITGPEARQDGHRWRARACAILTGMGTVRKDDPQLNVRGVQTERQPWKVVLDSRLDLSPRARLLDSGKVLVVTAVEAPERAKALLDRGVELLYLPDSQGQVDLAALLQELGRRECNELHVEAGVRLNGSLLQAHLVDELLLYLAPCLLGDKAQGLFNLPELTDLNGRQNLNIRTIAPVGLDIRLLARFMA